MADKENRRPRLPTSGQKMSSTASHTILCSLLLLSARAAAQVPRFESTPFSQLTNLRSPDAATRQAAVSALARFKRSQEALAALTTTLRQDPNVAVRQGAATALARLGPKGRPPLVYAAVCDPDPATRQGLEDFAKRAKVRCDEEKVSVGGADPLPRDEAGLLGALEHPAAPTRYGAMMALHKLKSAKGYQKIWTMATTDPVYKVRIRGISIISASYKVKALKVLNHALTRDPDARCRAFALKSLAQLKVPQAAKLIAASARVEQIPMMKEAAIKALGLLGSKEAVAELAALAEAHEDEKIRAAAVEALAGMKGSGKAETKEIIARVMRKDRSGEVRAAALKFLATDSSDTACLARAESIDDPHPAVRGALISQLARCKPAIARPALEKAARGDQDSSVRKEAVQVLIKQGAAKVMGTLVQVIQRDKEAEVRALVLAAIGAFPKEAQERILADVAKNDREPRIRHSAVEELTKLPAAKAVPPLSQVLQSDADPQVRLVAAKALGRFKEAEAYKALSKAAAADASPEVRKAAAAGASKSPAQKAWVSSLLPQTIDSDEAIRRRAVTQLCQLQSPRTYRALVHALWMDEAPSVRAAVAKGFAEIDHPLIDVGLVVAHETDPDGAIVRAVEATQQQRVGRLNALLEATHSEMVEARMEAVKSLYPSPFKKVRQALEEMAFKDDEADVRRAAATALYQYKDRRALNRLMRASQGELHAKTRQVKIALTNKLRKDWAAARRTLTLATLMADARTTNKVKRLRAIYALGTLKDRGAYPLLAGLTADADGEVRYAAVVALATFGDLAVVAKARLKEKDPVAATRLIKLDILRKQPDKVISALLSKEQGEVLSGVHAASIKPNPKAVPALVRVALANLDQELRLAAVRALVLHDHPLAHWAMRVASSHDASKEIQAAMWNWAVYADVVTGGK